jgi:hypothetical protein
MPDDLAAGVVRILDSADTTLDTGFLGGKR